MKGGLISNIFTDTCSNILKNDASNNHSKLIGVALTGTLNMPAFQEREYILNSLYLQKKTAGTMKGKLDLDTGTLSCESSSVNLEKPEIE